MDQATSIATISAMGNTTKTVWKGTARRISPPCVTVIGWPCWTRSCVSKAKRPWLDWA